MKRRCIVCLGFKADHTPRRLSQRGFLFHRFDSGERRAKEYRPRRSVWSQERREKVAA